MRIVRNVALLIAAAAVLSFMACSKPAEKAKAEPAKAETPKPVEKTVMRLSSVLTKDNPQNESMQFFADMIKEKTGGAIEIQIFPSSQLGEQRDGLEALKAGTLELLLVSIGPLGPFVPKVDVLSLPYIFTSLDHMHKAVDGEPGNILQKDIEAAGFKLLYWMDSGSRSVINNKKPIKTPADLKGLKIRVMNSNLMVDTLNKMGAIATPMGQGEVYSALQQKVLDGWENNPITLWTLKLYEVSKYYSFTRHFTVPDALLMSKIVFDKLSPEQKTLIMDAGLKARDKERALYAEKEGLAVEELKKKGVIFNDVPDVKPFQETVKPVWKAYIDKNGPQLVEMIQKL